MQNCLPQPRKMRETGGEWYLQRMPVPAFLCCAVFLGLRKKRYVVVLKLMARIQRTVQPLEQRMLFICFYLTAQSHGACQIVFKTEEMFEINCDEARHGVRVSIQQLFRPWQSCGVIDLTLTAD